MVSDFPTSCFHYETQAKVHLKAPHKHFKCGIWRYKYAVEENTFYNWFFESAKRRVLKLHNALLEISVVLERWKLKCWHLNNECSSLETWKALLFCLSLFPCQKGCQSSHQCCTVQQTRRRVPILPASKHSSTDKWAPSSLLLNRGDQTSECYILFVLPNQRIGTWRISKFPPPLYPLPTTSTKNTICQISQASRRKLYNYSWHVLHTYYYTYTELRGIR